MKWHAFVYTITAAYLCTLPLDGVSAHCDIKSWNYTLKLQQQIDENYNFHAERFNQLLHHHLTQPLLHQEFTAQELVSLWASGSFNSKQKLEMQIDASRHVIQAIEEETSRIKSLQTQITEVIELWSQLSAHCQAVQLATNSAVSQNYAQSNATLTQSVEQLIAKLLSIQNRYEKEVSALMQTQTLRSEHP